MKRTPMVRTAFHRKEPSCSRSEHPRAKDKECAHCHKPFTPFQSTQRVCNKLRCAMGFATSQRKAKEKAERENFKARKEAVKTIGELIEDTQRECNSYIRLRDAGKPCFDCGKPFEPNKPGGSMDAGHLRGRSSAGHLRFDENNIFGQRKNCNRPGGASEEAKRAGAVARIGEEAVAALYADNRVHKWQRDELIAKKLEFRAKRRALNQLNATPTGEML